MPVFTLRFLLWAFIPIHEIEISFHCIEEVTTPQQMQVPNSQQSFVFVRQLGPWCALCLSRHTPATAPSSPEEDAEVHVPLGGKDYSLRIKTINIILTISAKIAEGITQ